MLKKKILIYYSYVNDSALIVFRNIKYSVCALWLLSLFSQLDRSIGLNKYLILIKSTTVDLQLFNKCLAS